MNLANNTEDSYRKHITYDEKSVLLDILDTAGQEEYSAMRDTYMRTGKGFLLVYSITDPSSFAEVNIIYEQLCRSKDSEEVPIVLVGNKCDLESERSVSYEEGKCLAERMGNCKFVESSAFAVVNVEKAFAELARSIEYELSCEEHSEDIPATLAVPTKKSKKKCMIL